MCRSPILLMLSVALVLASPALSAGELRTVQLQDQESSTRAVIELGSDAPYKLFTLANPDRLVLDLPGTRLSPQFKVPAANGLVANLRTGKPEADTLRIVFDLGAPATSSSRIEREGGKLRLIVDIQGKNKPAPAQSVPMLAVSAPTTPPSTPLSAPRLAVSAPTPIETPPPVAAPVVAKQDEPASTARGNKTPPAKTLQDVIGAGQRKLVIAIDAGHGGKDPGAHGPSGVQEKKVTLAVARELARQIDADPGMKAVLIRDSDTYVALPQRYMRARNAQADLFISIHADAAPSQSASGASVYVLSTRGASSQAARWLADKENAVDLVGGVSLDDKDRNLSAVLLDLSQSATMRASDDVANQVLAALKKVGKAHKPGIERANFVVLRSPDVPSMLVETGFITNPGEEKKLDDPEYRQRLAAAIKQGVRQYFSDQPPPGTYYAAHSELRPTSREHVVGNGETLSLIAAQHGVALDSLRQANGLKGDSLRVGERLTIPLIVAGAPE
ncbi:N-acetylmuramoyl-L-alanine amidase [Arenimonas sp.]|uniref:N-acetylmuramoyl-L-alanine amidase n=1 Tax=Arenimonas sp. TaxID=1872635 RepID=UPI0039E60085